MSSGSANLALRFDADERRATIVIALVGMLRMFGLFALLPVMALHAGGLPGATPLLIGIAVGGYGLTQAALQIPLGMLSDRVGRVRVIVFGLLLFAAGSAVAAMAGSIAALIAGRLLQGAGAVSATLTALLADATRSEIRTRTMAIYGIGVGSTFLVALVAGPVIASAAGAPALFWVAAGLAGLAMLLLAGLPRGLGGPNGRATGNLAAALRPGLLRLDLAIFLLHALLSASFVALPLLLRSELAIPVGEHWRVYTYALVGSLAGTVPLILLDERRGKGITVALAVALLMAGQLLLALLADTMALATAGLLLFFAGFNFLEAALPARLSIEADQEVRGAALGVFSSAQFLGIFAGGLFGGWLLGAAGAAAVFLACGLLALAWLLGTRLAAARAAR